jgi:hypothetical protein
MGTHICLRSPPRPGESGFRNEQHEAMHELAAA